MIKLTHQAYSLELKHPFTISKHTRNSTPILLLNASIDTATGYGEASMVPYMGESIQTAENFLSQINLNWLKYPFSYDELIEYLDFVAPGLPAIKAAIDIALHDLEGKIDRKPCYQYFESDLQKNACHFANYRN